MQAPDGLSFYSLLLDALRRQPAADFERDLLVNLPRIFLETARRCDGPRQGYVPDQGKAYHVRELRKGDKAVFWNGAQLILADYPGEAAEWLGTYAHLADKIVDMARRTGARTVVTFGGGCGLILFHLVNTAKSKGLDLRLVNIERDADAVRCADFIAMCHAVRVENICLDMMAAQERPDDLVALERLFDGDSLIFVTHGALHPHFADTQYEALFDFVVNDLRAAAGIHWEALGFRTPAYAKILQIFSQPPALPPRLVETPSDPFKVLLSGVLPISIVERQDILAHFLLQDFPSYLSWQRI
jgi:hypothetical protein